MCCNEFSNQASYQSQNFISTPICGLLIPEEDALYKIDPRDTDPMKKVAIIKRDVITRG